MLNPALNLKIESLLPQPPIAVFVEAVEPCGAVGDVLLDFVQLDEDFHRQDLFAEVPLVQLSLHDRLVKTLQLRQREFRGKQLKADRLIAHFSFQPLKRRRQNFLVIEGQAWYVADAKPGGTSRIGAGP